MPDPNQGQSAPAPSVLAQPVTPVASASDAPSLAAPASIVATDAPAGAPSWFDELPDGLKSNPTLQNFKGKSVKDVAESLVNAEKLVGGSLRLPTDKDTPAEKAAKLDKVFTQLGRPEKPDGYKLVPPGEDTGVKWDSTQAEQFKTLAHQIGLSQAQVEALASFDVQRLMANQVDTTQAYNTCMETLQKDWGAGTKQLLGLSRRTAATYFDKDTLAAIESSGLSNNPAFVKAIASMGKELMEEGLIVGAREGMDEDGGITNLQAEIDRTMNDSKHAYWNSNDPAHDAAVIRMDSLRRALLDLTPSAR